MKRMCFVLVALLACASVIPLIGQAPGSLRPPAAGTTKADGAAAALSVKEQDGGTVTTGLGYNIKVNKDSSLHRRWFIVNDPECPLKLSAAGIHTVYKSGSSYSSGEYTYQPLGSGSAEKDLYAVEVRFVLFDVWGSWMQALSSSEVRDLKAGTDLPLSSLGSWRAGENDVSQLHTIVSYVAHARLAEGTIWNYDAPRILREIQAIKLRLNESELAPERKRSEK